MEIKIGKAAPNNEDACLEHHFFDDSVPVQTITGTVLAPIFIPSPVGEWSECLIR